MDQRPSLDRLVVQGLALNQKWILVLSFAAHETSLIPMKSKVITQHLAQEITTKCRCWKWQIGQKNKTKDDLIQSINKTYPHPPLFLFSFLPQHSIFIQHCKERDSIISEWYAMVLFPSPSFGNQGFNQSWMKKKGHFLVQRINWPTGIYTTRRGHMAASWCS